MGKTTFFCLNKNKPISKFKKKSTYSTKVGYKVAAAAVVNIIMLSVIFSLYIQYPTI